MAKHRIQRKRRATKPLLSRRVRGLVLFLALIAAAVAGAGTLIALGLATQGGQGIERLAGIAATGRTLGEPDAPVTIIEFGDYQCPHCKEFEEGLAVELQEKYITKGLVKLEFRNMAILGDESFLAAEAAQCANDQGKFWEYHDALFAHQRGVDSGGFSPERLVSFAEDVGLDVERFTACMEDGTHRQLVEDETQAAEDAGAEGTPFFLITAGGLDEASVVRGTESFDAFAEAIDAKLAEAGRQR